jgi:hypothetical protein
LKVLEDPREGVSFILVTSNKDALIPTLLSRLQIQTTEITKDTTNKKRAELFLKTPSQERMKLPEITELLGKVDEEGRKDREAIKAFILQLALVARTHENLIKYTPHILETSSYASDSSSSGKALLEYLALLLPEL